MKFNISLKVLPLLACGMLMASCNDFLKQEPLTDITPTDYYKDATQLQAVANAFYQTVLPYHSGAGYGTFAYDNGTDNQTGSDGDSKYKKGSWKTSNDNSSWSWNNIRDINYQLNTAQSNYENGLIAGDENKIRQYIGELHFFRAYAYFSPFLHNIRRFAVGYLVRIVFHVVLIVHVRRNFIVDSHGSHKDKTA